MRIRTTRNICLNSHIFILRVILYIGALVITLQSEHYLKVEILGLIGLSKV